jgi:hypothetical protein
MVRRIGEVALVDVHCPALFNRISSLPPVSSDTRTRAAWIEFAELGSSWIVSIPISDRCFIEVMDLEVAKTRRPDAVSRKLFPVRWKNYGIEGVIYRPLE